jgi:hypothetical protein
MRSFVAHLESALDGTHLPADVSTSFLTIPERGVFRDSAVTLSPMTRQVGG